MAGAGALVAAPRVARAQSYPSKPVRIVVQVNAQIPANDLSVSLLYGSDPNPQLITTEDTGTCCEALVYSPDGGVPAGEYQVQICQTPNTQGVPQTAPFSYIGTFTADSTAPPSAGPSPTPNPTPNPSPAPSPVNPFAPRYYNYAADPGLGDTAGEPTIGFNLSSKRAMYIAGLQTLRVTFAEQQGARSWELRARTSLVRLLADTPASHEARRQLAALCTQFTEGRETPDMREACRLGRL